MALDPIVRKLLDAAAAAGRPELHTMAPVDARKMMRDTRAPVQGPVLDTVASTDRTIPGPAGEIPVRIYRPKSAAADAALPALVYFHGGGWVIGDIETHHTVCQRLAAEGDIVVVSVDYRLAPEHAFPAAVDDCWAATCWVARNAGAIGVDGSKVAVGGDSAGGNLAAVVALMARDRGGVTVGFQLLIYPAVDALADTGSMARNAKGYLLTTEAMRWFYDHYVPNAADRDDWRVSPLRARTLANLPPAMVFTAGFDPLRDEGVAYARRLAHDGVVVEQIDFSSLIHGFFGMPGPLPQARRALAMAGRAVREALTGG
ncbi:MAG: alpha/beta hydrolase [Rhodospirillales bacterium]|nr:alpha/beta hydrolase [Rhodospirillales bacterium]QQS10538.1 MAG: alpha/beta hydrolase [Rhodospirillales bacterium]